MRGSCATIYARANRMSNFRRMLAMIPTDKERQLDRFREAARDLCVNESDDALNRIMGKLDLTRKPEAKVCPECGHVFKGNGWDGIDAHWKSKHEAVMTYEEAWPLLKSDTYPT